MHPAPDRLVLEPIMRVPESERRLGLLFHETPRHLAWAAFGDGGPAIGKDQRASDETGLV
jgi:hypothetical protein